MRVLGISAFYHDSAAALVQDGQVLGAAQEERFSRRKHDASFPHGALDYLGSELGLEDVDYVVFYEKPYLKLERLLETYLAFAPAGFGSFRIAMPTWLRRSLFLRHILGRELARHVPSLRTNAQLLFTEHHESHAASAFFPSPFEEAAILTLDGVGEWATTTAGVGKGSELQLLREITFPHSLGLLYSAFTYHAGFEVNSGEYKLMGLAPYGEPRYAQRILDHLVDVKDDGSFRLDLSYFDYCTGLRMTNDRFDALFDGPPRSAEHPLTERHMDMAASVQRVVEEIVIRMTRELRRSTGMRDLCMAGGVALNCVAAGKVARDGRFERVWVQPASGDAGGALGAALAASHRLGDPKRKREATDPDGMHGALLGPAYSDEDVEQRLRAAGARVQVLEEEPLLEATVAELRRGAIVGWFQGRMEFGPRALGARSILADARDPEMQSRLNRHVKLRETFRPFAPAVLAEEAARWFDLDGAAPYMVSVTHVAQEQLLVPTPEEEALRGLDRLRARRSTIPAVTHVDGSSRVQTVHRELNARFHALLTRFHRETDCPVLVNTSFNVRGEPIVCTPEDALRCFQSTELDLLVAGRCLVRKAD